MGDRLLGLPLLLIGLYLLLMSRERFEREAERDARRMASIVPRMNERRVEQEVRTQLLLRKIVPPIFVAVGALVLLSVVEVGEG